MKIRTRLALWYLFVSIIILALLSGSIYWGMRQLLYKSIDDDLEIFTDMIESSYNPVIGEFEELLWRLESAKRFEEVYLIVYNSRGTIEFASPMTQFINFEMPLPQDDEALGFTSTAKLKKNIPILKADSEGNVTFRGISRQMFYKKAPIGWMSPCYKQP